jgi:probable FeS assembly SUF system protein SufT
MQPPEYAAVRRECRAIQIPEGIPGLLSPGTRVRITQALGGSYTVVTERGTMMRIEAADADAIGKTAGGGPAEPLGATLEDRVWSRLKSCYDPEIPVNIVDLGLVYSCEVGEGGDGGDDGQRGEPGSRVSVKMTLTAPGCGMGPILAQEVKEKVEALPGVRGADVEIVFDPPWNQAMMTEAARLELGLF